MEQIRVKNEVGYVSLVAFMGDEFPMKHGNYFSLSGYHVLNMWHENFEHLKIKKKYIDAVKFGDNHIVIVDEDIPDNYLNDSPCFTGGGGTTPEATKEIYEFIYSRYKELKCMCCESAKYVSFQRRSSMSNKAGLKLSTGKCHICSRDMFMNNGSEVDKETFDKLQQIWKEAPSESGLYRMPYKAVTTVDDVYMYTPNPELLSRYAKKKVNKDYYGAVKISDLKEQENKDKDEEK